MDQRKSIGTTVIQPKQDTAVPNAIIRLIVQLDGDF
jgi:hypothetical protein